MRSTRFPSVAMLYPTLQQVVDFPLPPLLLAKQITVV
jgi:hypothetical protein